MQLGSLESFIAQAKASAGQFVNATEAYVSTQISNFRDKRGQLNYALTKLKANIPRTDAPQSLKDQYAQNLAAAQDAKEKADWLGAVADQFTAITGLGILPVVAGLSGAALLAAIAIIGATIYSVTQAVSNYVSRAQAVDAAIKAGRDPLAALQQTAATQARGGIFGDLSQLIWPVAIIGVLYLLYDNRKR
jgi:hypothetical protein